MENSILRDFVFTVFSEKGLNINQAKAVLNSWNSELESSAIIQHKPIFKKTDIQSLLDRLIEN